ncbi:MAG: hypothetical protein KAT48_14170 [Bacteroidales bacterium]|nr:hypothetical protein [Bacteroidales bacterium]
MLAIFLISPVSANVVNGGFETGDFTGWYSVSNMEVQNVSPHGGVYHVKSTNPTYTQADMCQDMDLTGFGKLAYWVGGNSPYCAANVYIDGFRYGQHSGVSGYEYHEIDVSGFTGVHTVKFNFYRSGHSNYIYFDDIELIWAPPGFDGDFESGGWTHWTSGSDGTLVYPYTYSSFSLNYPYTGTYGLLVSSSAFDFPFSSTDHWENSWVTQTVNITGADTLEFTAKMSSVGSSNTNGYSAVGVGSQIVYVTSSSWTDYAIDISSLTGNQEIKLSTYAQCDGSSNDDRLQNLFIDDLVLTDTEPDVETFTGTPYIRFNPDLNYDTVGNHMIGQKYFKFDMGITAEYVGYDYAVRYSSGASDQNDTWYYGDHGWQTPDPYGPYEYENETLGYCIQCRDGNSINLTIELFYADYAGGKVRLRNVLATDMINYNCPCYNDTPPPTPTPFPSETPTPIPTPDPGPGGNETGNESINSSGMEGYYNSVDAVFGNLSVSMKEGMGFLTSPVENLTGHINTINTSFVSSFNQSTGHKSVLLAILVPFFSHLPVEIKSMITLSIIFILILLILRGNSGGQ